jgi:DNA-binding NarL/FixJ family response regulator
MNPATRILIVDDHLLFCESFASVLRSNYISFYSNLSSDSILKVKEIDPDVVLINTHLQKARALDLTRQILEVSSRLRIIMLGVSDKDQDILDYIEAGASGYVLLSSSVEDITRTIDLVVRDRALCSPELTYSLFSRLAELSCRNGIERTNGHAKLTSREIEVLQLMADGLPNKEIADRLFLSLYTVKNHVHNILEKLKVQDRGKAIEYADQKGLLARRRAS